MVLILLNGEIEAEIRIRDTGSCGQGDQIGRLLPTTSILRVLQVQHLQLELIMLHTLSKPSHRPKRASTCPAIHSGTGTAKQLLVLFLYPMGIGSIGNFLLLCFARTVRCSMAPPYTSLNCGDALI
jgi:hypothetical protein